jgi:hypothetical protein
MPKGKIIYKFNSGNLAILCSRCSKIIKTGIDFTEQELKDIKRKYRKLPAQYCETCKEENR